MIEDRCWSFSDGSIGATRCERDRDHDGRHEGDGWAWTTSSLTRLRPPPAPDAEALAQALAYAVIVNGDAMTLGQFLDRLAAYGDARVAEAGR